MAGKAAARVSRKTKKPLPRKGFRRFLASPVRSWHLTQVMEAAGIAPASRDPSMPASTCVSDPLIVGLKTPIGRVLVSLFHHEFSPDLNGRFDPDDPALASSGGASGRRPATKPLGSAVRQPYGERESSRHLSFGRLLTWPADQPRHATRHLSNPVDPGSPPSCQRASSAAAEDSLGLSSVRAAGQVGSVFAPGLLTDLLWRR